MRTMSLSASFLIAALGAGCLDVPDERAASTAQAVLTPHACFVNAGQPNPSNPNSRRFDASCSTPATGSFLWKYRWDFGDGSSLLTGNAVTDHNFPFTNSCYKVQLTVLDINGSDHTAFSNEIFCAVGPCAPTCPP
jgi:hypothetical protein